MKKLAILFAGLFIMAISVQNVNAQEGNVATVDDAEAGATIIAPLTLTNDLSLEFGKIVKSGTGGNVVITASDAPNRTPDGDLTFIAGDTWRPAQFTVTGDNDETFQITKPATITLDGPGTANMIITTSISGLETGVQTVGGSYTFYIGGSLAVAADQVIGDYSGQYEVTVQYE
jgi:Mat/Ecp fimbriae major subunit